MSEPDPVTDERIEQAAKWLFDRIVIEERRGGMYTSWDNTADILKDGWRSSARELLGAIFYPKEES